MAVSNYYRNDGWVKTTLGPAVAGAQVWVATQPANDAALPPSPLALIYSDDGLTPIVQPIITDGFGHYDFYTLPGLYTVIIAYNGVIQQSYPDQTIGGIGTAGSTSLTLLTNGTPNFNQTVQNLVQGAGILIGTDNFGNTVVTNDNPTGTTLKTHGATNTDQAVLNLVQGSGLTIASDSSGDVTFTNNGLPQPDYATFAMWEGSGATGFGDGFFYTNDNVEVGALGTLTAAPPTSTSGATVTFNAGVYYSNVGIFWPTRNSNFKTTCSLGSYGGSPCYWGISNNYLFGNGDPLTDPSANSIVVAYLPTTVNWQLASSVNGAPNVVDTGVAIVLGARYHHHIVVDGGTATLYINGVEAATLSILPTSAALGLVWYAQNVSGLGSFTTEFMYADNATP